MGMFDTVRRLSLTRVAGRKTADITWDGDRGWDVVRGKDADNIPRRFYDYVREGYRRNPVVRRCVDEIKTSFSEAPIRAYKMDEDGNYERLVDHPAEQLFVRPNGRDSGVKFIEQAVQHYLLGGNTFWEKVRNGFGVPVELHPIRPDRVVGVDVAMPRTIPERWEVRDNPNTNAPRWIEAQDFVHIPDTDPFNEVFGMPRLSAAAMETDTDNEASNYVSEVLRNFGSPGTVVSVDGEKVRQASMIERAESAWAEKFGPGRGRGKVAFLPGATRIDNIGFNLQQLEFKDLRHVTREGICAVFGVDPAMIGFGTAAKGGTLSGGEFQEMRQAFWEQTVIPMMRGWSAFLNAFVAPEYGENVWLMFDMTEVNALQPDRDADVARASTMAETGSFTRPEIRAEAGMDPDIDDGELIVVKGTVKFLEAGEEIPEEPEPVLPGEEEEDPVVVEEDEEEEEEEDGDDEEASAAPVLLAKALQNWAYVTPPVKRVVSSMPISTTGRTVPTKDSKDLAWKEFDRFARAQEPAYRLAAEEIYSLQATELYRLALVVLEEDGESAGVNIPQEYKGITRESLDEFRRRLGDKFNDYHRLWRRRYDDLMSQTTDIVADRLSGATGLSFNVHNPLVRTAIEERLNLIVGADVQTFRGVQAIMEDSFINGMSRQQIADRISNVVKEGVTVRLPDGNVRFLSAAERAKMIATTETTAISNGAAVALMRSTDIEWTKTWLSQGDDRVREEHIDEEADSEETPVPLNEPFRVTGLDAPGEPNCRCTVLFEQA